MSSAVLRADSEGAAALELALILPAFAGMLLGFLDFSYTSYIRSTANGALEQVARASGVGGAAVDPRVTEQRVEATIRKIAADATFTWDRKSYFQFSGVNKPEKLTDDKDGDGRYDAGDCWEDLNPNSKYDTSPGRDGVGGADDIVFYKIKVDFDPLVDISGLFPFISESRSITASTIVKRQPFAAQTTPSVRC